MKAHFSSNRINELRQYYQQIAPLFFPKEQSEMSSFLSEIENSGCCEIELYNNVYSILNKVSKRCKVREKRRVAKGQKDRNDESLELAEIIRIIDLIRLQFATRYYIVASKCEVGKEQKNQLRNNQGGIV